MADHTRDDGTLSSKLSTEQKQKFPLVATRPVDDSGQTLKVFGYILILAGIAALLTGGYYIMFGPETIRYNIVTGMTFKQHLQAYPGPIATFGFMGIAVGRIAAAKADQMRLETFNKTVVETLQAEDIELQDLGDDYKLDIKEQKDGNLVIGLVDVSQAEPDIKDV